MFVAPDYIGCRGEAVEFIYTNAPSGGKDMLTQRRSSAFRDDYGFADGVVKNVGEL